MNQPCRGQSCVTSGPPEREMTATGHRAKPPAPEGRLQGLGRSLLVAGMFALVLLGIGLRSREVTTVVPSIANHLPKDPLVAGVYEFEPAPVFDELVGRFAGMAGREETVEREMAQLDERLGLSFRDDVLGAFGPSFGFAIDPEPVDIADRGFTGWMEHAMNGTVVAATVRDETRAIAALEAITRLSGGAVEVADERMTIRIADDAPTLHATLLGRTLVASGSPELLEQATLGFRSGGQLFDGADFDHCLSQVETGADMLTYVNLPGIRGWLRAGEFETMPGAEQLAPFFSDDWSGVGMIQTSTRTAGGLRSTRFAPPAFGSGILSAWTGFWSVSSGAQVLGNWLSLAERKPVSEAPERTITTMRALGAAIEAYRSDNGGYPSTDGWSPADRWSGALRPYYHHAVTSDGWGRPLLVWSDGAGYRIVSTGLDGIVDADWTTELGVVRTTEPTADIVFVDGSFAVSPAE